MKVDSVNINNLHYLFLNQTWTFQFIWLSRFIFSFMGLPYILMSLPSFFLFPLKDIKIILYKTRIFLEDSNEIKIKWLGFKIREKYLFENQQKILTKIGLKDEFNDF